MTSWRKLKSCSRLYELAESPIDLSEEGVLTAKRIDSMLTEALGLKLFYATERVTDPVLQSLFELAEETKAIEQMEGMQAGKIVNFIHGYECENRPALHTAMRDFFENRNSSSEAAEASKLAYQELEKLKDFLYNIDSKQNFTDVVQIGIGGSDLGPQAIYLGLEAYHKTGRKVHFLSNVDPDDGAGIFRKINPKNTLFVIVSKSGSTLETRTNEYFVREFLAGEGIDPSQHMVAITGKGSPMDDPSKYSASFYIWDYIGGRYSATSMVGCFILAFALGMDRLIEFLRGANAMDKIALRKDYKTNLPLLSALLGIWNRNFLGLPTVAVIPYSQALSRFPAHLQQLDMESNGKRITKEGNPVDFDTSPIIWGEPGTNGQHSFFQMIHQGTTVVPLEIIGFKESQYREDVIYEGTSCQEKLLSNLFAQSLALAVGHKNENPNKFFPGNRPSRILFADRLDPYTMGALLSYYEHKVAFQGFIWGINSFDQEGVQLGKVLALKFLDLFLHAREGKGGESKEFSQGLAYFKHLM
ncbi:MAG: glucose-6-phosphate isomerase [Chlamydiae bacterium]|nr:glucose-6-phosphate isomerase [Chlamydiota bacterium]